MDNYHPVMTAEQVSNCRKLVAYLRTLPAEYPDFEMNAFTQEPHGLGCIRSEAHRAPCGTAACAAGHGPTAGIEPMKSETWGAYSERAFVNDYDPGEEYGFDTVSGWEWCFSADWSDTDNTAHGAAERIEWMLNHGVPSNARSQMFGCADTSYRSAPAC